ncbi:hypothetical protein E2C01_032796 [Portunus trituberculatus]|uniref:Uncharacterized protein n=1 Tax=Portunus trituberculatus TaxID=210409 RepID=A0A5B7F1P5_PORTR|nr:hypothetical protein [Portunus trituberculatus]
MHVTQQRFITDSSEGLILQLVSALLAEDWGEAPPCWWCGTVLGEGEGAETWHGQQQGAGGLMLAGAAGEDAPEP